MKKSVVKKNFSSDKKLDESSDSSIFNDYIMQILDRQFPV